MPTAPQAIEMKAPTMKETAVYIPSALNAQMTTNITQTKTKQIRYSCLRNYLAPYISTLLPMRS